VTARRLSAAVVCWALLVVAGAPPAVAPASATPDGAVDPADAGVRGAAPLAATAGALPAAPNNTSVRHRNPDDGNEDGDLGAVRAHLAGEMRTAVVDCSQAVRVGEFDPCEDLNGSFGDSLSKYVELSGATGSEGDDGTARSLRRAREEGREYARTVRRFREAYETYREARANGNASGARRAARELGRLADETDRTGENLTRSLRNATRNGTDLAPAGRAVDETTANVTRTVDGIESELFVGTNTTAAAGSPAASALDPLMVTGRVRTENGTGVADARVGLWWVRNGTVRERVRAATRTNATGHYRLVYRPAAVPTGRQSFVVRLQPSVESPYLPSNGTVTARVEQVEAELTVLSAPATAAYRDRLRTRVRVTAGRTAAGTVTVVGLPISTRIGEFRIGTGRTDEDGEAVADGRFPATVEPGERTLVVGFEESDRAVAPVTETVELDVRETATTVDATVRKTTERSLAVEGTLATVDGRLLDGRAVDVGLAGRSLGRLRTDANGSFGGNLTVPPAVLPAEGPVERDLEIAFDGAGGNLAPAGTTATVILRGDDTSGGLDGAGLALSMAASLLVAVAGSVLLGRRRSADAGAGAPRGTGPDGTTPEVAVDPSSSLDAVRAAMDAGDYDLVTTAGYRAVRRALAGQVPAGPDATHWEFYGACAADGVDPERLEAVRRLTERFERVAFAPDGASRSVAAASLADARAVLEAGGGDGAAGADTGGAADGDWSGGDGATDTDADPDADGS